MTRRSLLISGSALVVSFRLSHLFAQGRGGPAAPAAVDAFLAIKADGSVTILTSHVDVGTGLNIAYCQIAAEELGIPVERFSVMEGDTSITPDHGGTGGSQGIPRGGTDIRRAAATARQALIAMAAAKQGRPASGLDVEDGMVGGIAVADLIGGRRFDLNTDPNAPLRNPATYKVVGKPVLRLDLPKKATGRLTYVQDLTVPNMLYGRVIRPATFGAKLLSVDESSIRGIPDVRVVRIENFLGVVAKDEWAAVRAARELKVAWSAGQALPATANLEASMRAAAAGPGQAVIDRGDATAAISGAAKKLSASYYWPFQSHASLGPSCAVADVKDFGVTVHSSTQDTFGLRNLLSTTFSVPREKVRVVYHDGSGSYGSNGAYDAAADAFLLSRAVSQPVRLQWMRQDEHALDPKGPPQILEISAGLDSDGSIHGWTTRAVGPSGPQWTEALLGPLAAGLISASARAGGAPVTQNLDPPYAIPNLRVEAHGLPNTEIRTSNLRAPGKIGTVFAVESFVDELAAAAGSDPIAFRRRGLSDPRALAVIDRVVSMIGWQPRNSGVARNGTGRGFAYMRYKQMENYVAMAMEVSVDRATGKVAVKRVVCAHDCGLIVNPDGLRNQVEGNILHTLSRTLHEEVTSDGHSITSVDWKSYPILTFPEAPVVEVALIDRPDQPSHGAGEAASAPVAAALANAIFDATGARLRSVPFAPEKVRAALA